ncbi:hypothetical protein [Streptomyces sp. NPDC057301]|uniref:CsbD family protein n=1 Tax=Streptomyces sp. NPDC057301 TaxID=3346093 RepID=UPI00363F9CFA
MFWILLLLVILVVLVVLWIVQAQGTGIQGPDHRTHRLDHRNRRLQREGRTDRVSGSLKQAGDKAKDAFRR